MIINRRTSFTNLEYPNPFEDPGYTGLDQFTRTTVATASAGQSVFYKVPDGASGWYMLRVVPDGLDANGKRFNSWSYTYLHEGSVVFLWCNNGSTKAVNRNSLGANGTNGALGGAAGVICGFKKGTSVGDNNYGIYSTSEPYEIVQGVNTFRRWTIRFSDGREIERYTLGTAQWDATSSATAAIYILIDGKPCLSFEDPTSIMAATGATVSGGEQVTFDGLYLGTVPLEFNGTAFSSSAGLVVGQSGSSNGAGGAALGSSNSAAGSTLSYGAPLTTDSNGGIACFDFTRGLFESNTRRVVSETTDVDVGAFLAKIEEPGHDTSEPYAQKFTAPEALSDCTFTFYVNDVEYEFPSVWPDANKQEAFTGEYVTYIQGVHIGDTLKVTAEYADGKRAGGVYVITMHSLVYGVFLSRYEFLWTTPGDYRLILPSGTYYTMIHGAGGAGGENGANVGGGAGGAGGAGGTGRLLRKQIHYYEDTELDVHVGVAGLTYNDGGNGGARGAYGSQGGPGGAGGGGGEPSYIISNGAAFVGEGGGGGGGGGGGSQTANSRFACGSGGGGGGGYYRLPKTGGIFLANEITVGYDDYYNLSLTPSATPNNTWVIPAGNVSIGDTYTNTINNWFGFSGTTAVGVLTVTAIEGTVVTFRATQTLSTGTAEPTTGSFDILTETVSGQIESVPGKTGGRGGQGTYDAGDRGTQGNVLDFPDIYSGSGGIGGDYGGERIGGQPGANGGGASGAGGGANNKNADGSSGGRGGGGAGGCPDSGGGRRGNGGFYGGASDAYNPHTTPTPTIDYLGNRVTSGWGTGGTTNMGGTDGWIYLVRGEDVTEFIDLGFVATYAPESTDDAGDITGSLTESDDAGTIEGTIEETDDAGSLLSPTSSTPWIMGNITDSVSETKSLGNII